mmetsp:Transcript_16820/g.50472  ORF Transcript_16820/g.50472 Transcript_16820/m.50472 type:complete len:269 (+) Transcript_16820:268-1074(+)
MAHTPPGTRCLCSWQWRPRPIHDSSEGRTSSRVACPGARCVLSRAAAAAGAASGGSTRCESQGRCCRRCAWQRYLWHHGRQREVGGEKLAAVVRRASLRVSVARRTVRRTGERVAPSTLLGCILRPAAAVAAHIDVVGCLAAVDNEVLVPRDEGDQVGGLVSGSSVGGPSVGWLRRRRWRRHERCVDWLRGVEKGRLQHQLDRVRALGICGGARPRHHQPRGAACERDNGAVCDQRGGCREVPDDEHGLAALRQRRELLRRHVRRWPL